MGEVGGHRCQRRNDILLRPAPEERAGPPHLGHPPAPADRTRELDRTHLPPTRPAIRSGQLNPVEYETIMTPQAALHTLLPTRAEVLTN